MSCYERAEDGELCYENGESGDDLQAAIKYHDTALSIRREILQPKHPELASSLFNLGNVWEAIHWNHVDEESTEAAESMETSIKYYEDSKAILVASLGSDHEDTRNVENYLLDLKELLDDDG